MQRFVLTGLFLMFLVSVISCSGPTIKKPEQLIPKSRFEKMLTDIYKARGLYNLNNKSEELKKLTETDLYYSVLKKYDTPDSVFIRSLVYYSSFPKNFDKIQAEILEQLNRSQEQFHPKEELNLKAE